MAASKDTPDDGVKLPSEPISLTPLRWVTIDVPIVGTTPLIVHRWAEKSKQMMRDKQQGGAVTKKAPKQPEVDRMEATYWIKKGVPGFPAAAFKIATVDATRYFEKAVSFELLKRVVRVAGVGPEQLVRINGDLHPREDPVRVGMGTADLRYRNEIWPWKAVLQIRYLTAALTLDSLIALVNAGGGGGVGEGRPSAPKSKGGTFGCYEVTE